MKTRTTIFAPRPSISFQQSILNLKMICVKFTQRIHFAPTMLSEVLVYMQVDILQYIFVASI